MTYTPTPDDRRRRFEGIVAEVLDPVQRFVHRRVGGPAAQDIVADVLLVVWRRLDEVPADAPLLWCYKVARNALANHQRSSLRRLRLINRLGQDPTAPALVAPDIAGDGDPELAGALVLLSPDDQELLRLWAWERLEPREIAGVLGVSANATSIRLHRAKQRLRELVVRGEDGKDLLASGQRVLRRTEEGG